MLFNIYRLNLFGFNHFIYANTNDMKEGAFMNEIEDIKEYSFGNCSYIVAREFGKEDAGDIIMEKLTSKISPSQN